MRKTDSTNTLDSFDWDAQASEIDFFGENAPEGMVIDTEEKKDEVVETPTKIADELEEGSEEQKKEEEKEAEIFEEAFSDITPEEEESSSENKDEAKETSDKNTYKSLYSALKANGVFDEDDSSEEESEEGINEDFLIDKIDNAVEKKFEDSIKSLPNELKNIIKFVHNGGDLNEILSQYSDTAEILENVDLEDATDQEKVIRALLLDDGEDEELIESQIEFYKDSGKLKTVSNKLYNKWKENREAAIAENVERQEQARKQAIENQRRFKREISEYVSENKNIKGLSIGKADISELPEYIGNASVKLEDGRAITPFYRDLFESMKDKESLVILAKLVKNKFDFSDIKRDVVTKQTKEVKQDIQRQKRTTKEAHKRLIDYLD